MLISLFLSLALSAPAPQAATPQVAAPQGVVSGPVRGQARAASRGRQAPPAPLGSISSGQLRSQASGGGQVGLTFGGSATRLGGPFASVTAVPASNVYQVSFGDPGTGWQETCLIGIPRAPLPNAPLLVMFHGFEVSEWDCYLNSPIFSLALARGWYVVAPLGAHQANFGIPYSQTNTEFVLDWVTAVLPVDPNRVYATGFSMGGGNVTSYMARHLDAGHARFAAVVNHTGGTSIANTYWSDPLVRWIFEDSSMFNGSPATLPFEYAQVSMADVDFSTFLVDPATDMARNTAHIPLLNFNVSQEPVAYLRLQTLALHNWMQSFSSVESHLEVFGTTHQWSTLDGNLALDFLEQHTLQVPRAGTHEVLADREAQWHQFYVYQDAAGAFTPFRWTMLDVFNRVVIDRTENLQRIVIDSAALGLDTSVETQVMFGTQDGLPEEITLKGYPVQPLSVTRANQPSNSWSWDPLTESVTLMESNASNYPLWRITP